MEQRDPKDVPFVAMYVDLGASAIVTDDRDFEHPSLIKIQIEGLGNLVAKYNRGLFSFVIASELTPAALQILSQLVLSLIKTLFQGLKFIYEVVSAIINNATDELGRIISTIPSVIKDSLIGLGIVLVIIVLLDEKIRNNTLGSLNQIAKSVLKVYGDLIDRLVEWIKDGIKAIKDYVSFILTMIVPAGTPILQIIAIKLLVIFNNMINIANAIVSNKTLI
jgi:phage-related protein